jgi:23S rRNA (uracil747-C5)-methyltransferase
MESKNNNLISCNYYNTNFCKSCNRLGMQERLPNLDQYLSEYSSVLRNWIVSPKPFGLRAKARLSVSGSIENPQIGILDKEFKGIELLNCPQHRSIINKFLNYLPEILTRFKLEPYNIKERKGELKSIILQTNKKEDHLRIRFVLKSENLLENIILLSDELKKFDKIKLSITVNIQPIPHQIPEGDIEHYISGDNLLWEEYNGIKICFPTQSFMQVNPEIAEKLYFKASEIVRKYDSPTVLDLFCGAGGFALSVSAYSRSVFGFEISKNSIESAKQSAKINAISNATFEVKDLQNLSEVIRELNPEIIICNPPRRGLGEKLIESILTKPPKVILYSSCNVQTFLKDYEVMKEIYDIIEITPFEMFPMTDHYELLAEFRIKAI